MIEALELPRGRGLVRERGLQKFADKLKELREIIGFDISARGWGYQLEGFKIITKDQIDLVESLVNECRDRGYLPIDFVAEEEARRFSEVEIPEERSPIQYMRDRLEAVLECQEWYTPDWWEGEKYYVQMIVEKIDIKTLFQPICREYHCPIATSKGWSSKLQRAEYARRFKEAEERGLICVLGYFGDFDPDGLRISNYLRSNLEDLKNIVWKDGTKGYDPRNLIIDRFGLNYDTIVSLGLTWIDNLITGSGKNLASPSHPNYNLPYVQEYLKKYGERKCEANAIIVRRTEAEELCRKWFEEGSDKWPGLGKDALQRFEEKRERVRQIMRDFRIKTGLEVSIKKALEIIDKEMKT